MMQNCYFFYGKGINKTILIDPGKAIQKSLLYHTRQENNHF